MKTSEFLRLAWTRIDVPGTWIKHRLRGKGTLGRSAFCAEGALQMTVWSEDAATDASAQRARLALVSEIADQHCEFETLMTYCQLAGLMRHGRFVVRGFNDHALTTHEELRSVWEKATLACEDVGD